jgi:F-type H+-transporting ATPase subunit b
MLLFATAEHGFMLFDWNNNLINWLVLVVLLGILAARVMPAIFQSRQETIQGALAEAAAAKLAGQAFLAEQESRVSNLEKEADGILVEAKQMAERMKQEMEAQTMKEMADLRTRIEHEMDNERQLAISQLRTATAKAAIALTEKSLPSAITDSAKSRLLDQFLQQLEAAKN